MVKCGEGCAKRWCHAIGHVPITSRTLALSRRLPYVAKRSSAAQPWDLPVTLSGAALDRLRGWIVHPDTARRHASAAGPSRREDTAARSSEGDEAEAAPFTGGYRYG